jgi:hypothetical protein
MKGVRKFLLAAALVLLLGAGLAACGGDDSDDSTAASTASTTTEQTAPPQTKTGDDGSDQKKKPGDDDGGSAGGSTGGLAGGSTGGSAGSGSDDGASADDRPSGSDGSGSSKKGKGSASFRTPGGDNSIPNYGKEAATNEREAAAAAVLGFLRARAAGDWEAACGYIASITLKPLEQIGDQSPQLKGKDCPELLEGLTAGATASSNVDGGIVSFRFEGDKGFALYHGTDGEDYFYPVVKENGEWKVAALSPSEFTG